MNKGYTIVEVLIVIAFLSLFPGLVMWTDRTLEFWLTYAKHAPVIVPWWISTLVTIFLNGVILGINILSELIRLVI